MNCPSCNKNLASTLSVCFSCGTMLNDSVREELASKITPRKVEKSEETAFEIPNQSRQELSKHPVMTSAPPMVPIMTATAAAPAKEVEIYSEPVKPLQMTTPPVSPAIINRSQTAEIMTKTTSQTLIDFQNKNATLPDWRLQLQNSVRKRIDGQKGDEAQVIKTTVPHRINTVTNGATALKAEIIEEEAPKAAANPTIANALRRIEESRNKYLASEKQNEPVENHSTIKQFPRVLANRSLEYLPKQDQTQLSNISAKPNVVQFTPESKAEVKVEKYDTAKLPPLPLPAKISSSFDKTPKTEYKKIVLDFDELDDIPPMPVAQSNEASEVVAYSELPTADHTEETEEVEDFAPIALRFNAAIFDLLIGSFLSLLLLSPFMLLSGKFFSLEGFFAFLATCAIVMFIYMTTTIGFLGRTFGMRLFALEIVDIEENDYPTLHQAAVSSSIYLLSLAFGGIGFLTILINNEKRAAHDLLSKTIIVKEY